jgi:hypothetical protein
MRQILHRGVISRDTTVLPAVFLVYQYFAGTRFTWRSVFPVGITNLTGTPFFHKRGAGCIKKGACAPLFLKKGTSATFLREKGVPAKKMIPKCTDRDFFWYRYGKYREIPTDTDRKIPIRYTTLHTSIINLTRNGCSKRLCTLLGRSIVDLK